MSTVPVASRRRSGVLGNGKPPMRRFQSWRKASVHAVYTLKDVRALYGVSRNTPLNWIKQGLRPIDGEKPVAFRGDELNRFHRKRYEDARRRLKPDELFCVGCSRPRQPQGGQIDFIPSRSGAGQITGICPDCGKTAFRYVTASAAAVFFERYQVNTREENAH